MYSSIIPVEVYRSDNNYERPSWTINFNHKIMASLLAYFHPSEAIGRGRRERMNAYSALIRVAIDSRKWNSVDRSRSFEIKIATVSSPFLRRLLRRPIFFITRFALGRTPTSREYRALLCSFTVFGNLVGWWNERDQRRLWISVYLALIDDNAAACVLVRRNAVCVTRADVIIYCHAAGMKIEWFTRKFIENERRV